MIKIDKNTVYTQVPVKCLRDKRISLAAKGMYAVLCSNCPEWRSSLKGYASVLKEGRAAIGTVIKQLEEYGYLKRIYHRGPDGKYTDVEYIPNADPESEAPAEDDSVSDIPLPEYPPPDEQTGNVKINETNNNQSSIKEQTDCLYDGIDEFEFYLRRKLLPSEVSIWEKWQDEGLDQKLIKLAVENNEYRGDSNNLRFADETIRRWKSKGLNSIKDINNDILDLKYQRTLAKMLKGVPAEEREYVEGEFTVTEVGWLKGWRDVILNFYKSNDPEIIDAAKDCPVEVFKYLPNEVLHVMSCIYESFGNEEKRIASIKAKEVD